MKINTNITPKSNEHFHLNFSPENIARKTMKFSFNTGINNINNDFSQNKISNVNNIPNNSILNYKNITKKLINKPKIPNSSVSHINGNTSIGNNTNYSCLSGKGTKENFHLNNNKINQVNKPKNIINSILNTNNPNLSNNYPNNNFNCDSPLKSESNTNFINENKKLNKNLELTLNQNKNSRNKSNNNINNNKNIIFNTNLENSNNFQQNNFNNTLKFSGTIQDGNILQNMINSKLENSINIQNNNLGKSATNSKNKFNSEKLNFLKNNLKNLQNKIKSPVNFQNNINNNNNNCIHLQTDSDEYEQNQINYNNKFPNKSNSINLMNKILGTFFFKFIKIFFYF